jgi:hypothetical protein
MKTQKTGTKEEALLKALDELEAATLNKAEEGESSSSSSSSVSKGEKEEENEMKKGEKIPEQMKSQKKVNGGQGMPAAPGDSSEVDPGEASEGEPTQKSVVKSLADENDDLQKAFEVSDFLKSFSDVMIEAQEIATNTVMKSQERQEEFNEKVAKALTEMGSMLVEMKALMTEQGEQPASAPKTVLNKSEVSERFEKAEAQYTPQQTAQALTDMAVKGECDTVAVSAYETTGYLPEGLIGQVNTRLNTMFGNKR